MRRNSTGTSTRTNTGTRTGTARITAAALGATALTFGLAACATDEATTENEAADSFATAALATPDGGEAGTVTFAGDGDRVTVTVEAEGLEPGFRGFHVHSVGKCEPNSESPDGEKTGDFLSAGGHLTGESDKEGHGNPDSGAGHAGDMPPLLVAADGTASMTFTTDRLTKELLLDDDGSAVMVHSKPDNFANIPERYAPDGPDADTKSTGDAGDRALCGVVAE